MGRDRPQKGSSWLGFFYGGNIAGAVSGCLLAGFYLMRVHDMATATYVAFAINLAVAAIALALAAPARYQPSAELPKDEHAERAAGAWAVYPAIALWGDGSGGRLEVVWTRLLSLMFGGTVYTFSLILAVFLIGLGIGSSLGAFLARRAESAQWGLGGTLMALPDRWRSPRTGGHDLRVATLLADPAVAVDEPWYNIQLDLVPLPPGPSAPPACLWGAELPAGAAAVAIPRPGRRSAGRKSLRGQYGRRCHRRQPPHSACCWSPSSARPTPSAC